MTLGGLGGDYRYSVSGTSAGMLVPSLVYIGTKRGALLEDLNPTRRWSILDEAAVVSSAPIWCGRRSHVRDDGVQWAPGMVGSFLSRCRQCYMICKLCEEDTAEVMPLPEGEPRDGVG